MKYLNRLVLITLVFISTSADAQKTKTAVVSFDAKARPKNLSDSALLDIVQKQTFRYFWDFAHPVSGLSRERSNEAFNYGNEVTTIGGTGFGVMAVIVATERKWIGRDTAAKF